MLEVDGLFYHFILILGWKWSSIIYRYWLNQLRYITYEELTQYLTFPISLIISFVIYMTEIHYLWGIDTFVIIFFYFIKWMRYITYEELTLYIHQFHCNTHHRDTLPMRNWHDFSSHIWYLSLISKEIHYLWGIDTCIIINDIYTVWKLRYITYEELTLLCWQDTPCALLTWDTLPMRNWHA